MLFEGDKKHNLIAGWTDNYVRVVTHWDESLVNHVVPFHLQSVVDDGSITGEIVMKA